MITAYIEDIVRDASPIWLNNEKLSVPFELNRTTKHDKLATYFHTPWGCLTVKSFQLLLGWESNERRLWRGAMILNTTLPFADSRLAFSAPHCKFQIYATGWT